MTYLDLIQATQRRGKDANLQGFLADVSLLFDLLVQRLSITLDSHPWSFLRQNTSFQMVGPYTTGTIQTTQGSTTVQGTATGWTSAQVGSWLQIANSPPLQVTAVNVGLQQITLDQPYPFTGVGPGAGYSLVQFIYTLSPATPVKTILHMWNAWFRLHAVNVGNIQRTDPQAFWIGPPQYVSLINQNQVYVWPIPDQVYPTRCIYLQDYTKPTTLDTAVLWKLGDPWFLIDGLLGDLYYLAYQNTGQQHLKVLGDLKMSKFDNDVLMLDDRDSHNRYVPDDCRALPYSADIASDLDTPWFSADQLQRIAW